jgi:hypothetical protein
LESDIRLGDSNIKYTTIKVLDHDGNNDRDFNLEEEFNYSKDSSVEFECSSRFYPSNPRSTAQH